MAKNNELTPIGLNIYQDKKGHMIYYDRFTKKAYMINKSDQKRYYLFSSRIVIALVLGYFSNYLYPSLLFSIFVSVTSYLVILFFFRTMFLKELSTIRDFILLDKQPLYKVLGRTYSTKRIITIVVVSLMLAILTIVNVRTNDYDYLTTILNYIFAIGVFIYCCFYILVLFTKDK